MAHRDLLIAGGGITGLAAAYLAARSGAKVTVVEASPRFGGLLSTFPIAGTRLEFYYHHFFTHDAEINWLLGELGLADRIFYQPTTMGIFRDGAIHPFNGPADVLRFPPLPLLDRIRFAASSYYMGSFMKWRDWEHVSAMEWFYRYAGTASTEAIWRPMLEVKFGPYAEEVPAAWMVGRLRQRMHSRQGGDERLGYLQGSLQVLCDRLLEALRELGVDLVPESPVTKILQDGSGACRGLEAGGCEWLAGQTLMTIPTLYLAPLVRPVQAELADQLASIEYFGAVCTILELKQPLSDIYWLNVADAGYPFGGVIEHTNFLPPEVYQGRHIVYLSRYFAASDPLASMPVETLRETMLAPLKRIYPHFSHDLLHDVHLFRTRTAATVCDLNFSAKVPSCRSSIPGLFIASMPHIYPDERSTNNSIRIAHEAGKVMGLGVPDVPRHQSLSGQIKMNAQKEDGP